MIDMHNRMEDEVWQDKAMTLEVIYRVMEGLEDERLKAKNDEEKGSLADMAVFVLVSF